MTDDNNSSKTDSEVIIEENEETEETSLETKTKNIQKIELLVKELDRIKHKGGPDIRICPNCFSVRIKIIDVLKEMGIGTAYPTCVCMDCGWRSNKWLYLDRTMKKKQREEFLFEIVREEKEK